MPLKTVVKVGNISNLSDARYCSGMGVDMLGFRVVEGQPNYTSPKLFQEIRGWVSGPKIVAEIYGLTSANQLPQIIENYAPDYFELTAQEFETFHSHLGLPCIVSGPAKADSKIEYALLEESALTSYRGTAKLLVRPTSSDTVLDLIKSSHVAGVALDGTPEVRPGFKDYADLADILEKLDEY
jgi:phosphoribosylanthranilate isomerase